MPTTVTVHEAKTNLSELLRRVEAGEEIIIARGNKPVAILKDYASEDIVRRRLEGMGCLEGKFPVNSDEDLFEPMSAEELALWYGEATPPDTLALPKTRVQKRAKT